MAKNNRIINGKTHEQWREEILQDLMFDPREYLVADEKREKELNEQARRLNLAMLHLDAIFGMVEATKVTYRMAAEQSADIFRIALLDDKKNGKRGLALEGPKASIEGYMERLLRGEERIPVTRPPVATLLEKDVQLSMARRGATDKLNAAHIAQDAKVLDA